MNGQQIGVQLVQQTTGKKLESLTFQCGFKQ